MKAQSSGSGTAPGRDARSAKAKLKAKSSKRVHFLSNTTEWATPQWVFDILDAEFGFTLDPCATPANAKCSKYCTIEQDGLQQDWGEHVVFLNPPYGRAISHWMRKACEAARQGATVVCLIPARTDTLSWHEFAMKGEVRFIRGRIAFVGARHSAPFPSAVVVFRPYLHPVRRRLPTARAG
jgi:phage N-6-adenine-methyltransferase